MSRQRVTLFAMIAILALAPGCGDDTGSETDGGTDPGTDSQSETGDGSSDDDTGSDTPSDSDTGPAGEPCTADMVSGYLSLSGVCAASAAECQAGTYAPDPTGSCSGTEVCCLDESSCEEAGSGLGVLACQADACTLGGFQGGCADGGNCCLVVTVTSEGSDSPLDDPCALAFSAAAGMISFSMEGTCADEGAACEGGTIPGYEAGNCGDGLECCIDTDQCSLINVFGTPITTCQATPCAGGLVNIQAGCPDNGYCCYTGTF